MQAFSSLMDFSQSDVFWPLFPVFNSAFINICLYTVPPSQKVYSVKIVWVYYIASVSVPFNFLFLVYHYHEQNIRIPPGTKTINNIQFTLF